MEFRNFGTLEPWKLRNQFREILSVTPPYGFKFFRSVFNKPHSGEGELMTLIPKKSRKEEKWQNHGTKVK